MRNKSFLRIAAVGFALALVLGLAPGALAQGCPSISDLIDQAPVEPLSAEETAGVVFMREEEKLARDVYLQLFDLWGVNIFSNIAGSEQQHMDSAGLIIAKYGLTDPVTDDARGSFTNTDLAALYQQLTALGAQSLEAAMRVGATIEDLDLYDLANQLALADNTDLRIVYQNLAKGSRNHLRSFTGYLQALGVDYQAQYLTQAQVDEILAQSQERGVHDADGNLLCTGGFGGNGNGQGRNRNRSN